MSIKFAITNSDEEMLKSIEMKGKLIASMLGGQPSQEAIANTKKSSQEMIADAENDAKIRDIMYARANPEYCQSCAELGKECLEHQRRRNTLAHQQSCMLCVAGAPCYTHKPITDTADIWKTGFDALNGRVAQLKADLALEQTRHAYTRKQLDAALEAIAAMQRNGNEPNQEIHG